MLESIERKNKEENGQDKKIAYKMTLGADAGFEIDPETGHQNIYFFEVNGQNSGIPKSKSYRMEENPYVTSEKFAEIRHLAINKIINELNKIEDFSAREELIKVLKDKEFRGYTSWKNKWSNLYNEIIKKIDEQVAIIFSESRFRFGNVNPLAIELLTRDKNLQDEVGIIPPEYRIKRWRPGMSTKSKNGWWVLKPFHGHQSIGIRKVKDRELKWISLFHPKLLNEFVVQEAIRSEYRDWNKNMFGRPSNIRILCDINVYEDGTFDVYDENIIAGVRFRRKSLLRPFASKWINYAGGSGYFGGILPYTLTLREIDICQKAMSEVIKNFIKYNTTQQKKV